jgi:hypothetical protein
VLENRFVRRIFGPKMKKKGTTQWRKLFNNAILVLCPLTNILVVNPWRKRMDGACDKYRGGRICVQDFNKKT